MAISEGPIQFSGSMGGIRGYYDRDIKKWVYTTKGGACKPLIKNNPAFERTRGLNHEWQGCNVWSKLVREGTEELKNLKQGRNNCNLLKIAKQIQCMSTEDKYGKRSIQSSKFNYPLIGFSMSNAHPFRNVFYEHPELSITDDRREVTLRLKDFVSLNKFSWPEPLSYYRIFLTIFELPDVEWDKLQEKFVHFYLKDTLGMQTTYCDWMKLTGKKIDFQLTASFEETKLPRAKTTVLVAMGLEFAKDIEHGIPYLVKDNGTMAIIGCL